MFQGFGKMGETLSKSLEEYGAKCIGICEKNDDEFIGLKNKKGLNMNVSL